MKCIEVVTVQNESGLHIRPATQIIKILRNFKSSVVFTFKKSSINARNLMDIVSLAVKKEDDIMIVTEGVDAKETIQALSLAFKSGFH